MFEYAHHLQPRWIGQGILRDGHARFAHHADQGGVVVFGGGDEAFHTQLLKGEIDQ